MATGDGCPTMELRMKLRTVAHASRLREIHNKSTKISKTPAFLSKSIQWIQRQQQE